MKLPRDLSGTRCVRALGRLGFRPVRQVGSHLMLWNKETRRATIVPMHGALDTGTLLEILRQAGVDRAEFLKAL